jgi:hypothetical protein
MTARIKLIRQCLLVSLCCLCTLSFSQKKDQTVKLGFLYSSQAAMPAMTSLEQGLGQMASLQGDFAFGRRVNFVAANGKGHWQTMHIGIQSRFYLAFRQSRILTGLFVGPFVSLDRQKSTHPDYIGPNIQQSWTSIGLSLGFQQPFFDNRIRLDAGIKSGYRGQINRTVYHPDGTVLNSTPINYRTSYYAYLQIGYSF